MVSAFMMLWPSRLASDVASGMVGGSVELVLGLSIELLRSGFVFSPW